MPSAIDETSSPTVVDVAICGGGPTGLATALLMKRLGVSVCVIDAKPASLELGRADALNARTQQYLEVAGLLDELLPQGITCNTSSTFGDGEFKSRQNDWWVNLEHCLHRNFLMLGQPVVERMLSEKLGPESVFYGEQVASIHEDADGVDVVTSRGRRVRSKYALGADGARSMVRKAIGASFTGTKPEMLWAVLDTFIDTDFPRCSEIITFQLNGQSRVSWIPRERGLCRFYVLLDGEVSLELAQQSIKDHMAPHKVDFTKTEWYSTFDVKERIASTFISKDGEGRIFLAGDAAHVHSVNGGQGLNTGIADAFNLAWRLAAVVTGGVEGGEAARRVLRSYDTERRSTAQGVIDVAAKLVRDTVREAKTYVGTIERNAGYITGMGVSYEACGSPLVEASQHGIWRAGFRCPDMVIKPLAGGEERRLYKQNDYGKYLLLSVGKPAASKDSSLPVTRYSVLPPQGAAADASLDNAFTGDWVTAEDAFHVVVRPDMYIAFVSESLEACEAHLNKVFHA
ncbi:Monooxygenase, FAD-binding protein [Cordyceps fumosorosea ARSEF 2679]|uniref:Monooxygenase, FAD-binding protein n=1 Tax=Cordyceps fumosorosea (strain ARSEF 2679) TaxID=1081104 RepID=A0A162LEU5_CORFA|nr:Monooxygenase, FAD-binding protein [Cordyceps fumosorosea ARSEF 2679]OAA69644.1 Monooxygenase, FAD-binding protein [Cordyceps fumosorosea ARSEF 2679]